MPNGISQQIIGDHNIAIAVAESGSNITIRNQLPSPIAEPNPFALPYIRNYFFTGREAVLTRLHEQFTQDATAFIQVQAITGLGGMGKTQTAVEYAYRSYYEESFYDNIFWVKANTEANLVSDFAEIATQLALPVANSTQSIKISAVRAWLSTHHKWLLIFDNANTPDWLLELNLIPTNPQGKVLITSQASVFDQLNVLAPIRLDPLSVSKSVDMLLCRTGRERTELNLAAATELSHELGGLPLALEQVGAFIVCRGGSFTEYLKNYRKRGLSQLEKEQARAGQYPSSVLRTFKISLEAIVNNSSYPSTAYAASALLEMSAFLAPDQIPFHILIAGTAHLGETLGFYLRSDDSVSEEETLSAIRELLALLSQYSLVRWELNSHAYSVHRLVQAVVRDRLSKEEVTEWLKKTAMATVEASPVNTFENWNLRTELLPHWMEVAQRATQNEQGFSAIGTLLHQAGFFLYEQGRYDEAEPLLKRVLNLQRHTMGKTHPSVAGSCNDLANLYRKQGRYDEAELFYKYALELRQQVLEMKNVDQ